MLAGWFEQPLRLVHIFCLFESVWQMLSLFNTDLVTRECENAQVRVSHVHR